MPRAYHLVAASTVLDRHVAGRSLLCDHILGARRDIRQTRGEIAVLDPIRDRYLIARREGALFEQEQRLRFLRYLAKEFSGR